MLPDLCKQLLLIVYICWQYFFTDFNSLLHSKDGLNRHKIWFSKRNAFAVAFLDKHEYKVPIEREHNIWQIVVIGIIMP
jgi:hypothetical protein